MVENLVFKHDASLSHSTKDKSVVWLQAARLRKVGLKVWLDEWMLGVGVSNPAKIEEWLESLRMLGLYMSADVFYYNWGQLEVGTYRFHGPIETEHRSIPLRSIRLTYRKFSSGIPFQH